VFANPNDLAWLASKYTASGWMMACPDEDEEGSAVTSADREEPKIKVAYEIRMVYFD
jgi:hypothetical protein